MVSNVFYKAVKDKERKFNRRGVAFLEGFSDYEKATFVRFLERIGKILSIILILIGILFFIGITKVKTISAKKSKMKLLWEHPNKVF